MFNKKILAVVLVIVIAVVAITTFSYLTSQKYKDFSDEFIQVEIPEEMFLGLSKNINNNTTNLFYTPIDPYENHTEIPPDGTIVTIDNFSFINVTLINKDHDHASELYTSTKNDLKNTLSNYMIIDDSKHNYDGIVYNVNKDLDDNFIIYNIMIFDDDNMAIIILSSSDLDFVVHMAETFKLIT